MTNYIVRRVIGNLVVIWIVMTFVFVTLRVLPGDFAAQQVANQFFSGATSRGQSDKATQEAQGAQGAEGGASANVDRALQAARERLGLDDPVHVQYGKYWRDIVTGNPGKSFQTGQSVVAMTADALPYTLQLGVMAIIIAGLLAMPVGIFSAIRPDGALDGGLRVFAVFFLAAPSFWTAALLSGWAVQYDVLTIDVVSTPGVWEQPWGSFQLFIIPALAGGLATGAVLMRFLRSGLLEVLRQDYVRTAHAKGLRESVVVSRHVLRNALIPIVTILGFLTASLIAGNVILEQMFNIPGMGRQFLRAILDRDVPLAQFMTLLLVGGVVFVNLLVDISYFIIDPRVTVEGASS